jgi:hypothetical protein
MPTSLAAPHLLWAARQRSGTCRQAGGTATFPEGRTCPATLPVPPFGTAKAPVRSSGGWRRDFPRNRTAFPRPAVSPRGSTGLGRAGRSSREDPRQSQPVPTGNPTGPVRSPLGHPTRRRAQADGNIRGQSPGGTRAAGHAWRRGGQGHGAIAPAKVHRVSDMAARPEGATARAKVHCG